MSTIYNKFLGKKPLISNQQIMLFNIVWAVLALLYFLLFSAKVPGADGIAQRPEWYVMGTNIFEALAYLVAGVLCLRNWRSPQIVSGGSLWLLIGIGMLSYFLGGIFFGYTEIVLKTEPIVSVGDIFFVISYIFVGAGMILAFTSRRINLEIWQWLIVLAIAVFGSTLAWLLSSPVEGAEVAKQQLPGWVETVAPILSWFYVISDVLLLIIATTLLLAFWGGRVSLSWRMIAAASFSLYIADMWFKHAIRYPNYESGDILEVFWVFSGVLFGMGAVLEYDASLKRLRRNSGRKRT
ncbi:MAG: hypothetical protein QNJ63_12995 [Calothrix sp. MO_192.B10]|nr:hypothetical protein [Calothrix sp. MO_192.B10]